MPPTHVGDYAVERVLGQGGMGAVYLGRHPRSSAPVAIKTVVAGRSASPHLLQRFQAEAQALTRLRHPHLVPLLDAGIDRGVPFLVLEYVEGETLEARLRQRGPLSSAQAAETIRALAGAVHYAHVCQVVHRDLKPANVLLRPNGEPVLTDFGLALHLDAEGRLSTSGVCLGTPGFWSPEQARGDLEAIGPRSDVYGLGALLFACLTGQPPVRTDSLQANLDHTIRGERRPPSSVNERVDPDLDAICARCMALEPSERFASAEAVAGALANYLEGQPLTAARRSPVVPLLGGLVLLLAIALGALLARGPDAPPPTAADSPAPLPPPTAPSAQPTPPIEATPAETTPAKTTPTKATPATPTPASTPPAPRRPADVAAALDFAKRGFQLLQKQEFAAAAKLLSQAIARDPASPRRLVWIGARGYCFREAGAFRDAVADLTTFIDANPRKARPYFDRGLGRFGLRQFALAEADFDQALKLDARMAAARYWRVMCRLQRGTSRPRELLPEVRRFIREQRPPHPDLAKARDLVKVLERLQRENELKKR